MASLISMPKTGGFPVGYLFNGPSRGLEAISARAAMATSSGDVGRIPPTCSVRFFEKLMHGLDRLRAETFCPVLGEMFVHLPRGEVEFL